MKEFFLSGFLAGNELDVIDQKDIDLAVFFTETGCIVPADGIDQIVGEFLC
jgi:hypothetical protein